MGKIASGGELSRISLALKTAIGDAGYSQAMSIRLCSMKLTREWAARRRHRSASG